MVVAMPVVRVVEVPRDEVVEVVSMRDRFVSTVWPMLMIFGVPVATVGGRTLGRVDGPDLQHAFAHRTRV